MRAAKSLLSILPLAGLGSAHVHISGVPIPKMKALFSTIDPAFCALQTQPVGCLNNAQGSQYCSQFLSIPTATVCTTVYISNTALTATVTNYVFPFKKREAEAVLR
ncbi:hypothetical protein B0J12DRAFT_696716 [Macrophomina phaseolina]|uniref:Uncharacterized protein n=1 Tax=Macrophomina phaseolina TaxID=35725 RepID=A0ABQ8GKX7_9PEZI|nr:hypothetical protein B0J12DRAFT_696716 [Macrophomina phaseolina]